MRRTVISLTIIAAIFAGACNIDTAQNEPKSEQTELPRYPNELLGKRILEKYNAIAIPDTLKSYSIDFQRLLSVHKVFAFPSLFTEIIDIRSGDPFRLVGSVNYAIPFDVVYFDFKVSSELAEKIRQQHINPGSSQIGSADDFVFIVRVDSAYKPPLVIEPFVDYEGESVVLTANNYMFLRGQILDYVINE